MTFIIGKRSNLSRRLFEKMGDSVQISASDIENNIHTVLKYRNCEEVNIIFNNFQASTLLNQNNDFESYITKSILNTSKLLTFLITNKIKINKLIYTSSSSVYGNNKFCSENNQVKPMNLQGALKVSNEEMIKIFCEKHKINYTIARVFNMYGGEDKFSIVSKIKDSYLEDKVLNIINHGKAIRDYIYIDDVVKVYRRLIDNVENLPKKLNIATGHGVRVMDLLHALENENLEIKTNNIQREEISTSIADVSALSEIIDVEKFKNVKNFLIHKLENENNN